MATGDGRDDGDAGRQDTALAATTPGISSQTQSSGGTATSPGAAIAPPTIAGDESMLREGDAVARYRIDGYLGRGGMGVVYRARDPDLDRALAIKLVRSRSRGGDRMLREAQAMARLDHPNVVPIFDVGMRGQQVFLVMPFLAGGTLGDWCRAQARPWQEVVRRYVAAGRGLEAAHRAGIVHRDFKPDNVLVTSKGDVQVADFGLARAHRDDSAGGDVEWAATPGPLGYALTRAGELLGTPAYMAPEQLDGETVDAKADQFSFCVALHEGLYGVRPFEVPQGGGLADIREALATDRVRPAPAGRDVPSWIRDTIVRGVRHDPGARWPSMTALLDELERGLRRRKPVPRAAIVGVGAAAAVAGAVAVAIALGWTSSSPSRREPPPPASDRPLTPRQLTFRGDLEVSRLAPDDSAVVAKAGGDLILVPLAAGVAPRTLVKDASAVASFGWSHDAKQVMTVTRVDDERSIVELIGVEDGARERHELPVWPMATMLGPREIASAFATSKSLRITSIDGAVASQRCPIPGEFTWINSLHSAAGALFVVVQHEDDTFSVFRTDRYCTPPHAVLEHVTGKSVIVDRDGTHVGVVRNHDDDVVLERTPVSGGAVVRSAPLPDDSTLVAGRTAQGAVVVLRGGMTWQLVRLEGEPARVAEVLGAGSTSVMLDISPDGTRIARSDERGSTTQVVRVVPLDDIDAMPDPIAGEMYDFAWSPDGTQLAGLIDVGEDANLAIVSAKGGPIRLIPLSPRPTGNIVWVDDHRVAYLRNDNQTFVSLDLGTGKTLELFDATLGWTFHLAVNRVDGSLALYWNRQGGPGVYVAGPGRQPERIVDGADALIYPTWDPDGRTLWLREPQAGRISRYDVASRTLHRVFESMEAGSMIGGLWPQTDGRLLVQLARLNHDLVVLE